MDVVEHTRPAVDDEAQAARWKEEDRESLLAQTSMMLKRKAEHAADSQPTQKAKRGERLHNVEFLAALERVVKGGIGHSLKAWTYRRKPCALGINERRYHVDWDWVEEQGLARRRAVIENVSTGDRWFEVNVVVQDGTMRRHAVHLNIDQCSKGWPCGIWCFHGEAGLRGTVGLDRLHTLVNIVGDAKGRAGVALLENEWEYALNVLRGPWRNGGHRQTLRRCGDNLFSLVNTELEVFDVLYADLARDFDMRNSSEFGSETHRRAVFNEARRRWSEESPLAVEAQSSRWWRLDEAFEQGSASITLLLMILVAWGAEKKKWSSLDDCPFRRRLLDFDVEDGADEGVEGPTAGDDGGGAAANAAAEEEAAAGGHSRAWARRELQKKKNK